jgi:hypothetical protein
VSDASVEAEVRRLEDEIYARVLRRVARTAAIAVGVGMAFIGLAGWLSWSLLRERLVAGAISSFQSEVGLRAGVFDGLGFDTAGYADPSAVDMAEIERLLRQLTDEAPPAPLRRSTSPH